MKTYITLFLLFAQMLFAKHEISIAAIFQDEARFLNEWVDYHHRLGVEHFRLYNNNSKDDYQTVLQPWIDKGVVTLIQWPHKPQGNDWKNFSFTVQTGAYNNAINALKHETKWLALIDTDEFLTPTCGKTLHEILKKFPRKAAIYVNWCMYGCNDVWDCQGDLRGKITRHAHKNHKSHTIGKSIVQPKHVKHCPNPHYCEPSKHLMNANLKKVNPINSKQVCWNLIRLNHYWSRDLKFFREVKIPRYKKWGGKVDKIINREKSYSQ